MRKIYILAVAIWSCLQAFATPLTPEEALARLRGKGPTKIKAFTASEASKLLHTIYDEIGLPTVYIYTYSGDTGFMMIAADDIAPALLGYSESNAYEIKGGQSEQNAFADIYTREIQAARATEQSSVSVYARESNYDDEWKPIPPLVMSKWDQGAPYNNLLEGYATGCVATSMAQVLNYWKYPLKGHGSFSHYVSNSKIPNQALDMNTIYFDWENMQNTYTSKSSGPPAMAVATLMKACGFSVKMQYNGSSGAYPYDVPPALTKYFGYDPGIAIFKRSYYRDEYEWNQAIYNNIKEFGPVIFSKYNHTFICDGYSKEGYFHFNMGWSGASDGYYLPTAIVDLENVSWNEFVGNIRPPEGKLTLGETTLDGEVIDMESIAEIADLSHCDAKMKITSLPGILDSYICLTVTDNDSEKIIYKTILEDKINAQFGDTCISKEIMLPTADPTKIYKVNLDVFKNGFDNPESIGSFLFTGKHIPSNLEHLPFVEVNDGVFTIELDSLDPQTNYVVTLYASLGSYESEIGSVSFRTLDKVETGITTVEGDRSVVKFYNLQGIEIKNPTPGNIYIRVNGNKSEKILSH